MKVSALTRQHVMKTCEEVQIVIKTRGVFVHLVHSFTLIYLYKGKMEHTK
jgi:hypothetical protein